MSNFLNKIGVPSGCQSRSTLYSVSSEKEEKVALSETYRKALCRSAHKEMAATDTLVYKMYEALTRSGQLLDSASYHSDRHSSASSQT